MRVIYAFPGMGKTTAMQIAKNNGVKVVDTDDIIMRALHTKDASVYNSASPLQIATVGQYVMKYLREEYTIYTNLGRIAVGAHNHGVPYEAYLPPLKRAEGISKLRGFPLAQTKEWISGSIKEFTKQGIKYRKVYFIPVTYPQPEGRDDVL